MYEAVLNEREKRMDWPLLLALLGLMAVGVAFIYSAKNVEETLRGQPWLAPPQMDIRHAPQQTDAGGGGERRILKREVVLLDPIVAVAGKHHDIGHRGIHVARQRGDTDVSAPHRAHISGTNEDFVAGGQMDPTIARFQRTVALGGRARGGRQAVEIDPAHPLDRLARMREIRAGGE